MCGIVGMVANDNVNQGLYDALTVLQHRGQDAAGIATCHRGRLFLKKGNGLVRDVFAQQDMRRLVGTMGIGHCRYPTAGSCSSAEAQPFYVNSPYGICLAHNGNLTNTAQLMRELFQTDRRHINTNSDSEVLLNILAHELQTRSELQLTPEAIFGAMERLYQRTRGGFACVALITGYGVLGFRDPHGIRPLVVGSRQSNLLGTEYMLASESVALDTQGFTFLRDVAPGEAVYIDSRGQLHARKCGPDAPHTPCIFEHVYLARPDSIMDGVSVYKARLRMGEKLAEKILRAWPGLDIDVVIPIPDTSRTAALQLANRLGVKYREGYIKNRYIGRTFIMPGQQMRRSSVRQKLNAIGLEFRGKNVLLVEDSIVRGTTSQQIIQMARDAGARKVYFASAAPMIQFPNVYGIDMPAADELIAHNRTVEEVRQLIGADRLIYQDIEDLVACAREGNPNLDGFECSVFSGCYVTGDVNSDYLRDLSDARSDSAKQRIGDQELIDLSSTL
jgi:amidophosphoribosyltransferase